MCGIVGLVDPKRELSSGNAADLVRRMALKLIHRGPDDEGSAVDDKLGVALGFRRLAIQDISFAGAQPMSSDSKRYLIVFNGEIYNFQELRRNLEKNCVRNWRGGSDTEILLAMVEQEGIEKSLEKFDGMFAFALLDREEKRLHLVRDRMGEKPLYYGWSGNLFIFASELKAQTICPGWSSDLDREALDAYMRYAYVPAPRSIYRNIRKLPPGHLLTINLENLPVKVMPAPDSYWIVRAEAEKAHRDKFDGTEEEATDHFEELLSKSIKRRLVSDQPVGMFLSGGLDSSTIVAIAQNLSENPIKTFTIGFNESEFDESNKAKAIAKHIGTEHIELKAEIDTPLRLVESMPTIYDEPFADVSQLPTLLLSELTRKYVTVALSGDGGDELFLGYPRYLKADHVWSVRSRFFSQHYSMMTKFISPQLMNSITVGPRPWRLGDKLYRANIDRAADTPEAIYEAFVSRWRVASGPSDEPSIGYYKDPFRHPKFVSSLERMAYADTVSYLPDDLLVKLDRATMAVGLEARAPFLDHEIVRFSWNLPLSMKITQNEMKRPLRRLLSRFVPSELFDQPKQGFEPPIGVWLRGPLRDWAEDLLSEGALKEGNFIKSAPVRAIWREHLSGVRDWRFELWNVLMFQAWRRSWGI